VTSSLILANTIELLGAEGGVPSVNPACAGAIFLLADDGSYDLGAPQPTTSYVASLILDGERPFGRRASNRTITLPVKIVSPNGDLKLLAAAREVLEQTVDQDVFTITWTRDPGPGGTPMPLIIDCFRAQPTRAAYSPLAEAQGVMRLTLSIPALPYGRSDTQQQVSFAAPVPQTPPPPPPPVVIDTFSTISSAQHFQSDRCIVGPRSCGWDPDDPRVGDPGGQASRFTYTNASLATTLNLTGMTSIQMWLGFGSRYYTYLEYHGKIHGVSVYITLTDTSGNTLAMSRTGLRLPVSPDAQQPVFSRVSMPIPASATFSYSSVGGYTIEIINRHDRVRRLSWVTAYVDALTAYPPSQTANPVTRGALYTLYGLQGTARSAMTLAFQQPPSAGTPTTVTATGPGTTRSRAARVPEGRGGRRRGRRGVADGRRERRRRRGRRLLGGAGVPGRARPGDPVLRGRRRHGGRPRSTGSRPCSGPGRPGRWRSPRTAASPPCRTRRRAPSAAWPPVTRSPFPAAPGGPPPGR
jgi:hypothetical protein